jgi:hypothetical protein
MPQAMRSITTVNGRAAASVAVCSAPRPPASSRVAASRPSTTAQKTRWHVGDASWPPLVSMSTTSEPESEEVTKKVATSSVASTDVSPASGSCRRNSKSATASSIATTSARPVIPCTSTMWIAVPPKTVIQTNVKPTGTSRTLRTSSRIVRPREMRAMNRPTKGDQAIHQAQ